MYVAVKGGDAAIAGSLAQLAAERRGDPALPALQVAQIDAQLGRAVDRVMTEGALYDRELAALALRQAQGDSAEAVFLLRAYRTTLARFGASVPLETGHMRVLRRISAAFKDVPGGQVLGPTYDYTQRLLDFTLLADDAATAGLGSSSGPLATEADPSERPTARPTPAATLAVKLAPLPQRMPRVSGLLQKEGLIETAAARNDVPPVDLTREPLAFPVARATRLQALARGDEGWLLALGYATQRGYANGHPFAGEIRRGAVTVELVPDELGFAITLGEVEVTECEMINQFAGSATVAPQFTQGYGLAFGGCERKAIAMALMDRALRAEELAEPLTAPTQDVEFVLAHADSLDASGFVQHLKLPHHVDFQSELELVRGLRARHMAERDAATRTPSEQTSVDDRVAR